MLQFIRAPNFWYVYVRRYQQFCTLMADSLRESRTADQVLQNMNGNAVGLTNFVYASPWTDKIQ